MKSKNVSDNSVYFEKSRTFKLYFDSLSTTQIFGLQYLSSNTKDLILVRNHVNNGVDFYDPKSGKLVNRITIPKVGPNSISTVQGFYSPNLDSLIILPKGNIYQSLITDYSGKVIKANLKGAKPSKENPIFNAPSITCAPTIFKNQKIHAIRFPLDINIEEEKAGKFAYEATYDLKTDSLHYLNVTRPEAMRKGYWSRWLEGVYRIIDHKNRHVYSWHGLDKLQVCNEKGEDCFWVEASLDDQTLPRFKASKKKFNAPEDMRITLESVSYKGLYFDPYRKYYYRFAHLPIPYDPNIHWDYNAFDLQKLVLMAFDENFNKITELELPGATYADYACMITPEGIFIPRYNIYNKELRENVLIYDVFIPKFFEQI
jgi:hypothetical protein